MFSTGKTRMIGLSDAKEKFIFMCEYMLVSTKNSHLWNKTLHNRVIMTASRNRSVSLRQLRPTFFVSQERRTMMHLHRDWIWHLLQNVGAGSHRSEAKRVRRINFRCRAVLQMSIATRLQLSCRLVTALFMAIAKLVQSRPEIISSNAFRHYTRLTRRCRRRRQTYSDIDSCRINENHYHHWFPGNSKNTEKQTSV